MKSLVKILLAVFVFCSFADGQEISSANNIEELNKLNSKAEGLSNSIRELNQRQFDLVEELSRIDEKDKKEALRLKAEARRLYPCCPLADAEGEMFGMESGYTFRTPETGDGYFAVSLFYEDGKFSFSNYSGNHGFIMNIGKIPLENADEKLSQFAALAKYQPPFETENIKPEFVADKIAFRQSAAVKIGDTYILRAVSYASDGNIDSIFAVKVEREDADGSIIVFIKKIKDFPLPKREKSPKYEFGDIYEAGMVIKIHDILREKDFSDVRVEFVERDLLVKGSVSKGKAAEIVKFLEELLREKDPSAKIKNELTEK